MNYTWSLPVPQSAVSLLGHALYQPRSLTYYEPNFSGYHWMQPSPYAQPMYQYNMQYMTGYQQMTNPILKDVSPPAKRTRKELDEDLPQLNQVGEPPSAKRSRMKSDVVDAAQHFITKGIDTGGQNMDMKTGIVHDGISNLSTLLPKVASENSVTAIQFTKLEASDSTICNAPVRIEPDTNVHITSVPIEECPHCFTDLVPVQFTVNVVTAVMKTICHCGLNIEIDPKLSFCKTKSGSCQKKQNVKCEILSHSNQSQPSSRITTDSIDNKLKLPECKFTSEQNSKPSIFSSISPMKDVTCYLYPIKFAQAGHLKSHMKAHGANRMFKCLLCSCSYSRIYMLRKHVNKAHLHHETQQNSRTSISDIHSKVPNKEPVNHAAAKKPPYTCPRCERSFSIKQDRLIHIVTQSCTRADRFLRWDNITCGWECTSCDGAKVFFNSRDKAERHTRNHVHGCMISCPVCQEDFTGYKGNILLKHIRGTHPQYLQDLAC